jgi:hypothetical protein
MIIGYQSYDFGGPQVSKNNQFSNFATTSFRKAAVFSMLTNGPFVMPPTNRMWGSTIDSASNPFYTVYTDNSDHRAQFVALDIDGTSTKVFILGNLLLNITVRRRMVCS